MSLLPKPEFPLFNRPLDNVEDVLLQLASGFVKVCRFPSHPQDDARRTRHRGRRPTFIPPGRIPDRTTPHPGTTRVPSGSAPSLLVGPLVSARQGNDHDGIVFSAASRDYAKPPGMKRGSTTRWTVASPAGTKRLPTQREENPDGPGAEDPEFRRITPRDLRTPRRRWWYGRDRTSRQYRRCSRKVGRHHFEHLHRPRRPLCRGRRRCHDERFPGMRPPACAGHADGVK